MCNCECKNIPTKEIQVLKIDPDLPDFKSFSNWTDLYVSRISELKDDQTIVPLGNRVVLPSDIDFRPDDDSWFLLKDKKYILHLGFAMKLPENMEAILLPRSSIRKTGLMLMNSMGVIDNEYCGPDDEWAATMFATKNTIIKKHQRLFQTKLVEHSPKMEFTYVTDKSEYDEKNRGGHGSSGEF